MNDWKEVSEIDVIGCCGNSECDNEFYNGDCYLKYEDEYFCDAICFTRYMMKHRAVIEKGNT